LSLLLPKGAEMTTEQIAATSKGAAVVPRPADAGEQEKPRREPRVAEYDVVDDSGAASFPASDPPSWWGG
jgi:hypothetical protein